MDDPFIQLVIGKAVNYRIKGVINLPTCHDIQRFHVELVADALLIRPCGRNQEVQRLLTGIAGALGQNIVQFPVGLSM